MIVNPDGSVTLTAEEYADMENSYMKLNSLINGGVDNWSNYDDALDEYRAWRDEQEEE